MESLVISPVVKDILVENDLNWNVEKRPLYYQSSQMDPANPEMRDLLKTDRFGVIRQDTEDVLGIVSGQYEPTQNNELLQILYDSIDQQELKIERAGSIQSGSKIFFQLRLPEDFEIKGDIVKRYLFGLTSHDGSSSLKFGISSFVMSCMNQFNYFVRDSKLSFRHTQSIHKRIHNLSEEVNWMLVREKLIYEAFTQFSKKEASSELVKETVDYLLDMKKYLETHDEISTRKENTILELEDSITRELESKGGTYWGLFNGITHYANHKKSYPNRDNGQFESVMMGGGEWFMRRGFKFLLNSANMNLNLN